MYCIFFIESEEYQKIYVDSFAIEVAAKRKPSVPGEASRPQKRTPVSAQLVDGRRLKKGGVLYARVLQAFLGISILGQHAQNYSFMV